MAGSEVVDPIERAKNRNAELSNDSVAANNRTFNKPYNKFANGVKYGVIAGVIVGLYQIFLNAGTDGLNIGMGLVGFFLMTPVIWYALRELKNHFAAGEFYKNAAIFSMYISFFAGLTTIVLTLIGFVIGGADDGGAMSVDGINPGQLMANSFFQLVVGIVIGNVIGFIFMQGMKTDVPADEFIEKQV